jgi:hypothetical protein
MKAATSIMFLIMALPGSSIAQTAAQTTLMNTAASRISGISASSANSVYVNQVGTSSTISITQLGPGNTVDGATYVGSIAGYTQVAPLTNSTVTIRQGDSAAMTGKNIIDVANPGPYSSLNLNQGQSSTGVSSGLDAGGHYQFINVTSSFNIVTTSQTSTAVGQGDFIAINILSGLNTVSVAQSGSAAMKAFVDVLSGTFNVVNITQTGSSSHFASVTETGALNNATVTQSNSGLAGSNTATISLINAGSPASVNLTQTGGQSYSITRTCTTTCGTVTVKQGP